MNKKVSLIIIAGPSGVGKSTMVDRLCQDVPVLYDVVNYTTRAMRRGEQEGLPYHFVSESEFFSLRDKDFFVEWANVHGRFYGMPKDQIDNAIASGRVVIMDVDIQGARTFKSKYPDCLTIFILPPSLDELRDRIKKRDRMEESELEVRMKNAIKEMAEAGNFDLQVVNADFESAYIRVKKNIEEILKNR
jgi:guanylate kinase